MYKYEPERMWDGEKKKKKKRAFNHKSAASPLSTMLASREAM